jgi:hypothetical protein
MDMRIVRWAGVIASGAVALYVGFGMFAMPMGVVALVMMMALMACGTLLAKQPAGPRVLAAMGVLGAADAGMRLAFGLWPAPALNLAYLVAALIGLVSGVLLSRAAKQEQSAP